MAKNEELLSEEQLSELAKKEARMYKRNGWVPDVVIYRQIYRNMPDSQKEEFKRMVEEEYKKL